MTDLARKLLEIVPRIRTILVAQLRQQGVRHSIPQLQILERIGERPRTVSELAALQDVTKATMSATLTRMASQDLIGRERAPDDRRIVWITPTEQGRAVSKIARKQAEIILDEILAPLSAEEKDALKRGLAPLLSAVERTPAPNQKLE